MWPRLAALQGVTTLGAYAVANHLPFDSFVIAWDRTQLLYLAAYYLAPAVPLFFGGLIVGILLTGVDRPEPVTPRLVYGATLIGSGIGCAAAVAGLDAFGGVGTIVLAAIVAFAAAGAFAAPAEDRRRPVVAVLITFAATIDHSKPTVTCPAGHTVTITANGAASFRRRCIDCPSRQRCTTAKDGRSLTISKHDDELVAARQAWSDKTFLDDYRQYRPMVERSIAWMVTNGHRRVRCRGGQANRTQLAQRIAAINLRRLVNLGLNHDGETWATAWTKPHIARRHRSATHPDTETRRQTRHTTSATQKPDCSTGS